MPILSVLFALFYLSVYPVSPVLLRYLFTLLSLFHLFIYHIAPLLSVYLPYFPYNIRLSSVAPYIIRIAILFSLSYFPIFSVYLPNLPYTIRLLTLFAVYYLYIGPICSILSVYAPFSLYYPSGYPISPILSIYHIFRAIRLSALFCISCLSFQPPYAIRIGEMGRQTEKTSESIDRTGLPIYHFYNSRPISAPRFTFYHIGFPSVLKYSISAIVTPCRYTNVYCQFIAHSVFCYSAICQSRAPARIPIYPLSKPPPHIRLGRLSFSVSSRHLNYHLPLLPCLRAYRLTVSIFDTSHISVSLIRHFRVPSCLPFTRLKIYRPYSLRRLSFRRTTLLAGLPFYHFAIFARPPVLGSTVLTYVRAFWCTIYCFRRSNVLICKMVNPHVRENGKYEKPACALYWK